MMSSEGGRPTGVEELRAAVESRSIDLAGCTKRCTGVACDIDSGRMPRCLIFEARGSLTLDGGVIVVGLNPGGLESEEGDLIRKYLVEPRARARGFERYRAWLYEAILRIPYYTLTRAALTALGFDGPILWTELVKCQSGTPVSVDGRKKPVPFGVGEPFVSGAIKTCGDTHLVEELAMCPPEWPVVAAGLGVGDYLNLRCPDRLGGRRLIAVPHPTGSEQFAEVFIPKALTAHPAHLELVASATTPYARLDLSTTERGKAARKPAPG